MEARDIVQKTADDGRADDKEKRDAALRECLDAMPQNSREIIEGHYYFERSIEVRASTHDRSVAAIDKTPPPLRAGLLDCFIKISMPNVKWMAL